MLIVTVEQMTNNKSMVKVSIVIVGTNDQTITMVKIAMVIMVIVAIPKA